VSLGTCAFGPLYLCASMIDDADLDTRLAAAVAGGYQGIGLRPGHVTRAVAAGAGVGQIAAKLDDAGLELVEIGFLNDWWQPDDRATKSRVHEDALHRLKDSLGGRHMVVLGGPLDQPLEVATERFAGVGGRAAAHGLTVALEYPAWTATSSAAIAWDLVRTADRPNAGIVVDTWHQFRGTGSLSDLAAIPPDRIVAVQLSDGPMAPIGTELEDTFRNRRVPGSGEFDLVGLFRLMLERGIRAPLGVEVLSDELRSGTPRTAAVSAAHATRALLARVATR
jgi:sugar phosphate isomerase/epimerase